MSSSHVTKVKKRQRDSTKHGNVESKVKQQKTKSDVPLLRHRLFASPPRASVSHHESEKCSANKRKESPDRITKKSPPLSARETVSSDSEEICHRGSAAYAVLQQLDHEQDDSILFSEDYENPYQKWTIDLSREAEPSIPSTLPVFHHDRCPSEKRPEMIRRNEVLPQERIWKIGDYVSVHQDNINVRSGKYFFHVQTTHRKYQATQRMMKCVSDTNKHSIKEPSWM